MFCKKGIELKRIKLKGAVMKDISFAFTVYLLGFAVSVFIAGLIKFILFMIRKFSRKEVNN